MSFKEHKIYHVHTPVVVARPWLLMLPGVGCGGSVFDDMARVLKAHFNVVTLNNPWVEEADYPDLRHNPDMLSVPFLAEVALAVLDELGVEEAHVLGHSMGGFVAQRLALMAPARVRRLVLISTSMGGLLTDADMLRTLHDVSLNPAAALGRLGIPPQADAMVLQRHFACGAAFSSFGEWQPFASPTLVVHGLDDPLINVSGAEALARHISQARFLGLEGAGHMPFVTCPGVVEPICAFLNGAQDIGEALLPATKPTAPEVVADQIWRTTRAQMHGINAWLSLIR